MRDIPRLGTTAALMGACLAAGGIVLALQPTLALPGLALAMLGGVLLVFSPALGLQAR